MNTEEQKTGYFKQDAKSIVDMCFDSKIFRSDLTRDDMNEIENLISCLLQSRFDNHIRINKLLERIKSKPNDNK